MEIATIQDMTYSYPNSIYPALKNINLKVYEGDFILLIGESGSGKSTLAKVFNGIIPHFYGGTICGNIQCEEEVGIVFQDPEKQIIMESVEKEIAFPLENKGLSEADIKRTVMETLSFMNLWELKDKKTYQLSGGERQKVNMASSLAKHSRFLILDEPTSQLDPSAADDILNMIGRLNQDFGYTIILAEQQLDRCFSMANRIWYIKEGQVVFDGNKKDFFNINVPKEFVPLIGKLFKEAGFQGSIPETIRDGRKVLRKLYGPIEKSKKHTTLESKDNTHPRVKKTTLLTMKKVYFRYEEGMEALKDIDLHLEKGRIYGILGEIGSGKTTLLKVMSGLLPPSQGKMEKHCLVGYLSQNPNDYLFNDTVYEELEFTLKNHGMKDDGRIDYLLKELELYKLKDSNPRDLSGGEKQRVALASILVMDPELILLDEPTRGLDYILRSSMGKLLNFFKEQGKTIVIVTHDVEFLAMYAGNIRIMFKGEIVQEGTPEEVFSTGNYYSTQIRKLFTGVDDEVQSYEEGLIKLRLKLSHWDEREFVK
ncbi:MAG: ATP-binding cassette domain-containing protein [Peptostreptococcales bacterium]|jgi:energy-coupling factor transporter ATP-binding protein EcfA2